MTYSVVSDEEAISLFDICIWII